ncbi:hypothetical protein J2Y48_002910 [Mycoplana sp. BE70]|uniref:hypothetical protein n=1 Tax=Mycoplana sp. BE70 TaxID=2817775 RepID=UPI0028556FEB|nr:hypothetical protein [Mycoplana sp. BE70]MDR6757613.1 hypothetical protein [Mycoplana sp. BE70]
MDSGIASDDLDLLVPDLDLIAWRLAAVEGFVLRDVFEEDVTGCTFPTTLTMSDVTT